MLNTPSTNERSESARLREQLARLQEENAATRRQLEEAELRCQQILGERVHAEERCRIMLEHLPMMIDAFDLQGRVALWNRECERITGYSAAEVLGRDDLLPLLYPDAGQRARMLEQWREHGADFRDREWTLTGKDGARHIVSWSNIAARVPIPGWSSWAVGVDMTRRSLSAEFMRASEQRYQTLVQLMPLGVSEIDIAGTILFANHAYHRIYGYEPGTMHGLDIYKHYIGPGSLDDLRQRLLRLAAEQPPPDFYPCQSRTRDGRVVDLEASWDYRRDAEGTVVGFVALVADVTERKRAEEERRRIDERLRETQKVESLGVLAGGIAHDFNNLLMMIVGNADLARFALAGDSPLRENLDQIERASMRAAELCKQLLAYAGRGKLQTAPLDLAELVRETADLLRLTLPRKVHMALQLAGGLPKVNADATQIRQVVLNLILNGAEAIGERMGRVAVTVAAETLGRSRLDAAFAGAGLPEGEYVRLEVKDTGCGMADSVRSRIFEPFYSTKAAGRGLGLSSVVGIVRGHRGALALETAPGLGTTFRLWFPALEPDVAI